MSQTLSISHPGHVPAERIVDVDIYDLPGADKDVHRAWQALADRHDLVWTPRNGGHWIATGGDLIMQIYRDTERFSNCEIAVPAGSMLLPTLPIQIQTDWILYAILIAIGGAVLGALYPAFKAAQKDPIEALAYE